MLNLISWNVNGLRAVLKKDAFQPIFDLNPDIICLQETKLSPGNNLEIDLSEYPHTFYHLAEKKGYSGTAIYSKVEPINVSYDFKSNLKEQHPQEGRTITAEFDNFFLVNTYVPNSKRELARLPYRYNHWDPDFHFYLSELSKKKPVVACGDFNVAHQEIDIANPKSNRRNAGFTDEERERFSELLDDGFIDTFRHFYPEEAGQYTWWSFRANARERNIGWRIDYFVVSKSLEEKLSSASIHQDIFGSDHAPVQLLLE